MWLILGGFGGDLEGLEGLVGSEVSLEGLLWTWCRFGRFVVLVEELRRYRWMDGWFNVCGEGALSGNVCLDDVMSAY